MGTLWRLYSAIALFFGARRRFVRRLAGVSLVLLGVHAGADLLDDVAYRLLDALDLLADDAAAACLTWLTSIGGMTIDEAQQHSEAFASWLELPQKEWASLRLAFVVELGADVLLLDLAWGTRDVHRGSRGVFTGLVDSVRELRSALRCLDLERTAVLPALLAYALGGALVAARAVEGVAADVLAKVLPNATWSSNAAAGTALLAAAVVLWRFAPDLLDGAMLRSYERGARAHERVEQRAAAHAERVVVGPFLARLRRVGVIFRQKTRGRFLLVVALPLALAGLASQSDLLGMLARLGAP